MSFVYLTDLETWRSTASIKAKHIHFPKPGKVWNTKIENLFGFSLSSHVIYHEETVRDLLNEIAW